MTNTRFGDGHFPVYVTKDKEGRVQKNGDRILMVLRM